MSTFEILVIALLVILALTIIVGIAVIIKQFKANREVAVSLAIDTAEIEHHVQVNAVLALTKTFTDNPELSANLAGYSQQVVDAALLHRVNSLGHDLKIYDKQISYYNEQLALNPGNQYMSNQLQVAQELRESVQLQLNAANQAISGRHLHAV